MAVQKLTWLSLVFHAMAAFPQPTCFDLLCETIYFRTAAGIQEKYLAQSKNQQDPRIRFYRAVNQLALGKPLQGDSVARLAKTPLDDHYLRALAALAKLDRPVAAQCRAILRKHNAPDFIQVQETLALNPFELLPEAACAGVDSSDVQILWRAFYAAIILDDQPRLDQVFERFARLLEPYPKDKERFDGAYRAFLNPAARGGARSLAYLYLAAGGRRGELSEGDRNKVAEVKAHYLEKYFLTEHVVVNKFTLDNNIYLWLAAQQEEIKNPELSRVLLKATFSSQALVNFNPDNQVLLYATIRSALRLDNVASYKYILRALDPLVSGKPFKLKDQVRAQALQLID